MWHSFKGCVQSITIPASVSLKAAILDIGFSKTYNSEVKTVKPGMKKWNESADYKIFDLK